MRPYSVATAALALVSACTSSPPAETKRCGAAETLRPPVSDQCRAQPRFREYGYALFKRIKAASRSTYGGRRTTGTASFAVQFGADGAVDAVCLIETSGELSKYESRLASNAIEELLRAPPGPACVANHRIDSAMEVHGDSCQTIAGRVDRFICETRQRCIADGWSGFILLDCIEHYGPWVSFSVAGVGNEYFVPASPEPFRGSPRPADAEAKDALEDCEGSQDAEELAGCMSSRGWRTLRW
jgi:hypothetical protein